MIWWLTLPEELMTGLIPTPDVLQKYVQVRSGMKGKIQFFSKDKILLARCVRSNQAIPAGCLMPMYSRQQLDEDGIILGSFRTDMIRDENGQEILDHKWWLSFAAGKGLNTLADTWHTAICRSTKRICRWSSANDCLPNSGRLLCVCASRAQASWRLQWVPHGSWFFHTPIWATTAVGNSITEMHALVALASAFELMGMQVDVTKRIGRHKILAYTVALK